MAQFPIEFGFADGYSSSATIQVSCTLDGENVVVVYYTDTDTGYQYLSTYVLNPTNIGATYTCTNERGDGRTYTETRGYYNTTDPEICTGTSFFAFGNGVGAFSTGCDIVTISGAGSGTSAMLSAARAYFDTPQSGSGTATVEIDIEGERLTFESQSLGNTITRFIDDDAEVDMEE